MRSIDKAQFAGLLEALATTFGKQVDKAMLLGYWMGLSDLTESALERACMKAIRTCKFMPKPAELRELAGILSPAAQAALAFADVDRALAVCGYYRSPNFEDVVINATIRNLGGWLRVCELSPEEFDKWFRKDFERVYAIYAERGVGTEAGQPLIGYFEQQNAAHGHDADPPMLIASSLPKEVLAIRDERRPTSVLERCGVPMIEVKTP